MSQVHKSMSRYQNKEIKMTSFKAKKATLLPTLKMFLSDEIALEATIQKIL